MVSRIRRVGGDFDEFVKMMQQNLTPIVGKKPSYTQLTNDIGGFILDERSHERMLRRAQYLQQRRRRGFL